MEASFEHNLNMLQPYNIAWNSNEASSVSDLGMRVTLEKAKDLLLAYYQEIFELHQRNFVCMIKAASLVQSLPIYVLLQLLEGFPGSLADANTLADASPNTLVMLVQTR